jgi:archaellin
MELTGGIIATTNSTQVLTLRIGLTLAAGGESVNLDAGDTNNRTVLSYADSVVTDSSLSYTTTEIVGDGDELLESGELAEVVVNLATECATCVITENETFTLELKPPTGSYLVVQRTTPASMTASVINLN